MKHFFLSNEQQNMNSKMEYMLNLKENKILSD